MPDNPHPHPPEFTGSKQEALVRLMRIVSRRLTAVTDVRAAPTTNTAATAYNYIIKPEN